MQVARVFHQTDGQLMSGHLEEAIGPYQSSDLLAA